MNCSELATLNYTSPFRVNINQGGTSSGKTYSLLQMLFAIACNEENKIITVVGQDVPNLKKGAYRDAKRIWADDEGLREAFDKPNETDRIFKCRNTGSIIEFTSYQDEQDARSGKRDYLFVNEANGISFDIYWQLAMRTKEKIFLDYNPTCRFWAHDLVQDGNAVIWYSDHRDNKFLTKEQHELIESIKDPELYKVYARGETGKIEGLVYSAWHMCDTFPANFAKEVVGLDFGFTNDPTAIVHIRLAEGQLWVREICYRTGMTNADISDVLRSHGLTRTRVVADSAEPKSIAELKRDGLNVVPALKGPDSIKHGIDTLKQYTINVERGSLNIKGELERYKWEVDRDGHPTNKPIDQFNHAMDALRYGATTILNNNTGNYAIKII